MSRTSCQFWNWTDFKECLKQRNDCPFNATDNSGLDHVVGHLEKIYTTIDWPFVKPINENLKISLYQSGKSRADLWQFAGLVALEQAIERANRACDLDYFTHQQVFINRISIR